MGQQGARGEALLSLRVIIIKSHQVKTQRCSGNGFLFTGLVKLPRRRRTTTHHQCGTQFSWLPVLLH